MILLLFYGQQGATPPSETPGDVGLAGWGIAVIS